MRDVVLEVAERPLRERTRAPVLRLEGLVEHDAEIAQREAREARRRSPEPLREESRVVDVPQLKVDLGEQPCVEADVMEDLTGPGSRAGGQRVRSA